MIKKFKEFSESKIDKYKYPTKEDIEDQFLRLKEVFGCNIIMPNIWPKNTNIYINFITDSASYNNPDNEKFQYASYIHEIDKELEEVKCRIERIFPVITIEISKMPDSGVYFLTLKYNKNYLFNNSINTDSLRSGHQSGGET